MGLGLFDDGALRTFHRISTRSPDDDTRHSGSARTELPSHELAEAYAQGDFARLRIRARVLRDDADQPETLRKGAGEWLERVSVDVVTYVLLAFALVLFCAIVVRYAL